jgi:hypothetical protein
MDDLVGVHIDVWDYITFLALIVIAVIASRIASTHARPGPPRSARGSRRRWGSCLRAGASSVRREWWPPYREVLVLPSGVTPWKLC